MKMKMEMKKKLISIGLAAILVIGVFAAVTGIASAQTYSASGQYIEGTNVTVNTTGFFNTSWCCRNLEFQINNTLNTSARNFTVTNHTGLTTNASGTLHNQSGFYVHALTPSTYWVKVANEDNSSEYVNFTVEYKFVNSSSITGDYVDTSGDPINDTVTHPV